jgi:hypothetical protein
MCNAFAEDNQTHYRSVIVPFRLQLRARSSIHSHPKHRLQDAV